MGVDPPAHWPHREASQFCEVQGLRWHVQRWSCGEGVAGTDRKPVALLLHGTGSATHSWRHLAPLLARRFDVLAPDLPGHGFTLTPDTQDLSLPGVAAALSALMVHLGVQPQLLVGHSAGAAIACRLALDGAFEVHSVVAINGALLPLRGAAGQLFLPMARLLSANPRVAPAFSRWVAGPRTTQHLLRSTGSHIDTAGQRCYEQLVATPRHTAGTLRLMASWDLRALQRDLHRLPVPLQLIVGEGDRTLSPAHAERVRQLLPRAQIHHLPRCGHLAHEEDAAAVAAGCERAWATRDTPQREPHRAAGRAEPPGDEPAAGPTPAPAPGHPAAPDRPGQPLRAARA